MRTGSRGEPLASGFAAQELATFFEIVDLLPGFGRIQPGFAGAQRDFHGRAGQVGGGDIGIVGICDRVLEAALGEFPGV